jgi:gamma-glutamyltranspeptidase/glutathione hydrolase
VVTPHLAGVWTRYRQPGIPDGYTGSRRRPNARACTCIRKIASTKSAKSCACPTTRARSERIARGGWREFHLGALGDEIAADLQANGAYVTRADIAGFEPEFCAPLEGSYRGYTVRSNPPPGSGATLIQMLQILEHFALGDHSSARHLDSSRARWRPRTSIATSIWAIRASPTCRPRC